jgi:hypothetical protein
MMDNFLADGKKFFKKSVKILPGQAKEMRKMRLEKAGR